MTFELRQGRENSEHFVVTARNIISREVAEMFVKALQADDAQWNIRGVTYTIKEEV